MKFLGFPHRQQFILMLLGPLLNQTSDPGWQMTSEDIQVLYGYSGGGHGRSFSGQGEGVQIDDGFGVQ